MDVERKQERKRWGGNAAYLSWFLFLCVLFIESGSRGNNLVEDIVVIAVATIGAVCSVRAVRFGPLKILGYVFLVLHAGVISTVLGRWIIIRN